MMSFLILFMIMLVNFRFEKMLDRMNRIDMIKVKKKKKRHYLDNLVDSF